MAELILTLTANPAIDLNFSADRLAFDDRAYLLARSESAGGRGINASQVLHRFGVPTLAVATTGGETGRKFEGYLSALGFPADLVRIRSAIRTNYSITDRQGLTVKLDEAGPRLEADEIEALRQAVLRHLAEADWLMLCGSLPPGVPGEFYRALAFEARRRGVRVLLDADGTPLAEALEARPAVVAPNHAEAERLLSRALVVRGHYHEAAAQIRAMGAESVILSLGNRGAVVAHGDSIVEVIPPRVDAVCPIGAGDTLNAAFLWAVERGEDFMEAVRWGVAAGTATARLPGLRYADLDQARDIHARVEVRPVG